LKSGLNFETPTVWSLLADSEDSTILTKYVLTLNIRNYPSAVVPEGKAGILTDIREELSGKCSTATKELLAAVIKDPCG
jgi:hypothetical protein